MRQLLHRYLDFYSTYRAAVEEASIPALGFHILPSTSKVQSSMYSASRGTMSRKRSTDGLSDDTPQKKLRRSIDDGPL